LVFSESLTFSSTSHVQHLPTQPPSSVKEHTNDFWKQNGPGIARLLLCSGWPRPELTEPTRPTSAAPTSKLAEKSNQAEAASQTTGTHPGAEEAQEEGCCVHFVTLYRTFRDFVFFAWLLWEFICSVWARQFFTELPTLL